MPETYIVLAPNGQRIKITGDKPPTTEELQQIFTSLPQQEAEGPKKPFAPEQAILRSINASQLGPAISTAAGRVRGAGAGTLRAIQNMLGAGDQAAAGAQAPVEAAGAGLLRGLRSIQEAGAGTLTGDTFPAEIPPGYLPGHAAYQPKKPEVIRLAQRGESRIGPAPGSTIPIEAPNSRRQFAPRGEYRMGAAPAEKPRTLEDVGRGLEAGEQARLDEVMGLVGIPPNLARAVFRGEGNVGEAWNALNEQEKVGAFSNLVNVMGEDKALKLLGGASARVAPSLLRTAAGMGQEVGGAGMGQRLRDVVGGARDMAGAVRRPAAAIPPPVEAALEAPVGAVEAPVGAMEAGVGLTPSQGMMEAVEAAPGPPAGAPKAFATELKQAIRERRMTVPEAAKAFRQRFPDADVGEAFVSPENLDVVSPSSAADLTAGRPVVTKPQRARPTARTTGPAAPKAEAPKGGGLDPTTRRAYVKELTEEVRLGRMTQDEAVAEIKRRATAATEPAMAATALPTADTGETAADVAALPESWKPFAPGGKAKGKGRRAKLSEEAGGISPALLTSLGGATLGGAAGGALDEEDPLRGAAIGAVAGGALGYVPVNEARIFTEGSPSIAGRPYKTLFNRAARYTDQARQGNMLSGLAPLKSALGAGASVPIRVAETAAQGHPLLALRQAAESVGAIPAGVRDAWQVAKTGQSPMFQASPNQIPAQGIFSLPRRVMGAMDAIPRQMQMQMTATPEDLEWMLNRGVGKDELAARELLSGGPQTDPFSVGGDILKGQLNVTPGQHKKLLTTLNQLGPIARHVAVPVGYTTGANLIEQGLQRTPGLNLLTQFSPNLKQSGRQLAGNTLMGAGAMGTGAVVDASLEPGDWRSRGVATAAMGKYGLPAGIGMAANRYFSGEGREDPYGLTNVVAQQIMRDYPIRTESLTPRRIVPGYVESYKNPWWNALFGGEE